jgi:hypothetical protein
MLIVVDVYSEVKSGEEDIRNYLLRNSNDVV